MNAWRTIAIQAAILTGALIFQQTLVSWIAFGSVRPDILLIALTAVALRYGPVAGLYAGMAVGLVQDVYAVEALGANALAKCVTGYLLGFFEERVVKSMPTTRVMLLGAAFLLHDTIYYLAAGLHGSLFWSLFLRQTIPSMVYTLVVGAIFFYYSASFKSREV